MSFTTFVRRHAGPMLAALAAFGASLAAAAPFASLSFGPNPIRQGEVSNLFLLVSENTGGSLTNINMSAGAFVYPAGLTNTGVVPSISCPGATVTVAPGSNTFSIANGSTPFPGTSCFIEVEVKTSGPGSFLADLPQGAITTNLGPTVAGWQETLVVTAAFVVTTTADGGAGSLRDAIDQANRACAGIGSIAFNIPGTGPFTIAPTTELPAILCSNVRIDGFSQPGAARGTSLPPNPVIQVEINGSACAGCNGLTFRNFGAEVFGLAIGNFTDGILSNTGITLQGNFIGSDAGGGFRRGNVQSGVHVSDGSAQIGSGSPSGANRIANNGKGIWGDGSVVVDTNAIEFNTGIGVYLPASGFGSFILRNTIRGNGAAGVGIDLGRSSDFTVSQNSIFGNGGPGIDWGNDGTTPNDDPDVDGVPNAPVITGLTLAGGNTTIDGAVRSIPNTSGFAELYSNGAGGGAQGAFFIGSAPLRTDANGDATFSLLASGSYDNVTGLIVWDLCGDGCDRTSEFSLPFAQAAPVTVTPTSLDFGNVQAGTTSAVQSVFLTTTSRTPQPFGNLVVPPGFSADASSCTGGVGGTGCTVAVRFLPTAPGLVTGTMRFDAGGATFSISLAGNGTAVPAPSASVSPGSLAFAPRTVGTTSPSAAVTLTNVGNATMALNGITISGDFQFVTACGKTLAPGASCTIDVRFTPLVAGARTGVLAISTNGSAAPLQVALSGSGVATAIGTVAADPLAIEFDAQAVGTTSAPRFIDIGNSGTTPFTFTATVTGPFQLVPVPSSRSQCEPVVAPGALCSIAVVFRPTAAGTATGTVSLLSDASNPQVDISLVGAGVVVDTRVLSVPERLEFGSVPVGSRSERRAVTVTNRSSQDVLISQTSVSGDFSTEDPCGLVLAGRTCTFTIVFRPSVRGAREGEVLIRTLTETATYRIVLSGVGEANAVPALAVAPSFIGFGNALVGPPSAPEAIELTNVGEVPVLLTGLTLPPDFIADNRCAASLAPGARCTVLVSFFARVTGLRVGTLVIGSNAGDAPHRVSLSGTGCAVRTIPRSRLFQLQCTP